MLSPRARRELLATGQPVRKRRVDTLDELTPQEEHIARLALTGRTNAEIGTELFISSRTVEWHLKNVFIELGVNSRKGLHDALPPRAMPLRPYSPATTNRKAANLWPPSGHLYSSAVDVTRVLDLRDSGGREPTVDGQRDTRDVGRLF
jgi:DNA-binding CsgD family transcriptional regulator